MGWDCPTDPGAVVADTDGPFLEPFTLAQEPDTIAMFANTTTGWLAVCCYEENNVRSEASWAPENTPLGMINTPGRKLGGGDQTEHGLNKNIHDHDDKAGMFRTVSIRAEGLTGSFLSSCCVHGPSQILLVHSNGVRKSEFKGPC